MVTFKANVKESDLRLILTKLNRRIRKNVKAVLLNEALPHLVDLIMDGFDRLIDRANMLPEDPTNPANWREEFRTLLESDIFDTIYVQGTRISVNIGDKEILGYTANGESGDPNESSDLVWLVYYLEGLAGDWAFITPDLYERFRGSGSFSSEWGRFGQGFMLSREQFDAEGWDSVVPFEEVRHPFSGFAPLDIFTEAVREFKLKPFIDKAISAAVRGREL